VKRASYEASHAVFSSLPPLLKGKVVPVRNFTENHAMKSYCGVEVWLHAFLNSALEGGEWSASQPLYTPPPGKEPYVPIAGLDAVAKRKILSPCRESNTGRPAHRQALYRLSYSGPYFISSRYNCSPQHPVLYGTYSLHGTGYYLKSRLLLSSSKNIPLSYGTRRLITLFTKARHWTLS
jgi:hypothetical protein